MVDGHADVWGAMVPPSGVRGIPVENVVINIWRNLFDGGKFFIKMALLELLWKFAVHPRT